MCCNLIPAPKQSLLFLPLFLLALSWMATSRHQVKTLHSSTEMCSAERERERERYFFLEEGVLFLDSYNLGSSHSSCWYSYRMWQYQAWMSTAVQHTHNRAPVLRQRRRARGNGPRSSHGSLRALNEQDEKNVVHTRTVPKEGKKFPVK